MNENDQKTVKTYTVNNMRQLIDLNQSMTNFELHFKCYSKNKSDFDVLVVDQTTLDSDKNLEFRKTENGYISGKVISDQNVYQNYFLILKADQPIEVTVECTYKELPKQEIPSEVQPQNQVNTNTTTGINWKLVLGIIIVVGGMILIYWLYTRNKDSTPVVSSVEEKSVSSESHEPLRGNAAELQGVPSSPPPSNDVPTTTKTASPEGVSPPPVKKPTKLRENAYQPPSMTEKSVPKPTQKMRGSDLLARLRRLPIRKR